MGRAKNRVFQPRRDRGGTGGTHAVVLEGDKLLRIFADDLKESCRDYDYVARMGGDEFVIITPGMKPVVNDKISRLNQVAIRAGRRVCEKDMLSLTFVPMMILTENVCRLKRTEFHKYLGSKQPTSSPSRHFPPEIPSGSTEVISD
ncbi:MAG TPA: diguanylate cyclase [Candidatus Sulfotelmatobacter sp.]|nr:diguanylate cyclase [Candidatus Sulfotelmatobacter sp.]